MKKRFEENFLKDLEVQFSPVEKEKDNGLFLKANQEKSFRNLGKPKFSEISKKI